MGRRYMWPSSPPKSHPIRSLLQRLGRSIISLLGKSKLLYINNNTFYGPLPPQLGRLFRLTTLALQSNNFEGEIPANISQCSNLMYLDVGENKLVGKLPQELGALSNLIALFVSSNNFRGEISPFLGNLTSLRFVSAVYNLFSGSIPSFISRLKNLNVLALGVNNLSGTIPPAVYNLSSLNVISLDQNHFHGSLLPNIGSMLPYLQILQLPDNQFTGSLPISLSNCSYLEAIQVNGNYFSGKIAVDFASLKSLRRISLYQNNFGSGEPDEMSFIDSAANCTYLKTLNVGVNKLRGSIPDSVGNLSSKLAFLDINENYIYGRLPSAIGNLWNLTTLHLEENQLTGTIPSTIGNLGNIRRTFFHRNKLSGTIPESIGNLTLLTELSIKMNRLEGIIPASLGNCQSLLKLELSENNITGSIPKQLRNLSALSIILNLSQNHLLGSLPLEVGNLKNLGELDVSENNLSGEIPSGLGSCTSLERLYLQGNIFHGSIPESLSSLKGVTKLDLSRNNLSGQIPNFFENLSLKYLNLSFNNFEGEVPMRGVFANQSAVSIVGNSKLCGGIPELHLRKCSNHESRKHGGVSRVLIVVISITCTLLCVAIIVCFLFCRNKRIRKMETFGPQLKESFLRASYEKLFKATDGFSSENLIGSGSFGTVYKGVLDDQDEAFIAVKVLNLQSQGVSKSFMIECEVLRNARHRNLVKIITSCSSVDFHGNDFKALVYDFMPNGSLDRWLHSSEKANNNVQGEVFKLNLFQRINIATDVACALDYLHHHCENSIVHCDLKPSNILLDEDMVAHVGDFGLAKFILPEITSSEAIQSCSVGLRGTIGYAAPEYGLGSDISTSGDIYSFGILLLEMITRRRPTDNIFKDDHNLHNFASMALPDHVKDIVDPLILENNEEATESEMKKTGGLTSAKITEECLLSAIKIGVACSMESPQARMSITNAIHELNRVRNIILRC